MQSSPSSAVPLLLASQCRAGRVLVEWSAEKLALESDTSVQTIQEFETRFRRPDEETLRRIRAALKNAGVVFIDENGGGAGARLKLSRKELRALDRWEGEGGTVVTDNDF